MEELNLKSFLGTGWSFPPSFGDRAQSLAMVVGEEDIKQSLFLLFATTPGERLMRPNYGCDLHEVVFESFSPSTESRIVDMISTAVLRFEPRITVDEVRVRFHEEISGRIDIQVLYTIRVTNSRDNIVYPFYFREGTNLTDM